MDNADPDGLCALQEGLGAGTEQFMGLFAGISSSEGGVLAPPLPLPPVTLPGTGTLAKTGIAALVGAAVAKCIESGKCDENSDKSANHHIVAQAAPAAAPARAILAKPDVEVGIDSSYNTVMLPVSIHWYIHTTAYYTEVNDTVLGAYTAAHRTGTSARTSVIGALNVIRGELLSTV